MLGFQERGASVSNDHALPKTRLIAPRTLHASSAPLASESPSSPGTPVEDSDDDSSFRNVLFIPSTRSLTHPPLSLERLLHRIRSDDVLPHRSITSDAAAVEVSTLSCLISEEHRSDPSENTPAADTAMPSVFALTESAVILPPIAPIAPGSCSDVSETSSSTRERVLDPELDTSRSNQQSHIRTELPLLVAHQNSIPAIPATGTEGSRPSPGDQARSTTESPCAAPGSGRLRRSESAPTTFEPTLDFPVSQHARRYRGLAAALNVPSDFHVGRDRGASIFRKECEAVEASDSSRIRVSKSLVAQARIMEVRAQKALGERDVRHTPQLAPSLLRSDRQTFEQASAALMLAARAREVDMQGFCHPMR